MSDHSVNTPRSLGGAAAADEVLFFASGRSDFITGQVISVSGGLTMVG